MSEPIKFGGNCPECGLPGHVGSPCRFPPVRRSHQPTDLKQGQARIVELEKELANERGVYSEVETLSPMDVRLNKANERVMELGTENTDLREALQKYGWHKLACARIRYDKPCDCDWAKIVDKYLDDDTPQTSAEGGGG